MKIQFAIVALVIAWANAPVAAQPAVVKLADNGKALLPVVVAEKATPETKASAAKLADFLGRIAGTKFAVETGDGSRGIAVGLAADFPLAKHDVRFKPDDIT